MAKQIWNNSINKHTDWGGDSSTNNLPVSGEKVQEFIKNSLEGKVGVLYYDQSRNCYMLFADEENKDKYLQDPEVNSDLLMGTFDAPINYSAEISLASSPYVSISKETKGNYIEFTFETRNKSGQVIAEDVTCTYTIRQGSSVIKVTEKYRAGSQVKFNVDKFLGEGTNNITIGIIGVDTLAATTVSVTYQVVNLTLNDTYDISKVYDLNKGETTVEVPFLISGYGTKVVEWYVDGVQLEFDKIADEVVEISSERTKFIDISSLNRGVHKIEFRAYTTVEGSKFYSDVLHRDVIVENSSTIQSETLIALSYETKELSTNGAVVEMTQYIPFNLRFALFNPKSPVSTETQIFLNDELVSTIGITKLTETNYSILTSETGSKTIQVVADGTTVQLPVFIGLSTISIAEINEGLVMSFSAVGRNNNEGNKDSWYGNGHSATISGVKFNNTSGWLNDYLWLTPGSNISFDIAPLASDVTATGFTFEAELATTNVTNDEAIVCDLRNSEGVGLVIKATEALLHSKGCVELLRKYKSEENLRLTFVVNKSTGVTY